MTIQLAGCILKDSKNRILLLHRNTSKRVQWEIPGGKLEETDNGLEEAAIREIKEELGVDVKILRLIGSKEFIEDERYMHYTWFEAQITNGEVIINEPHTFDELRAFSLDELSEKSDLSANTQNLLNAVKLKEVVL